MAIIGLKDLHYAKIESESDKETEYGEVKRLGPAMALNIEPNINSANLRADDKVLFTESAKDATALELNTAYLEDEVEADILGKEVDEHGGIVDSNDDKAPYIAIAGRAESARGGYEWFWIYRTKFTPGEENKETKQDTPEYQTPNLTGEALPRLHDGRERYKLWDKNEKIEDDSIFDNWFEEVIEPDWSESGE